MEAQDVKPTRLVAAQKALLASLGVEHLVAVAGPSYGGYQAFQWAVAYPQFIDAIVPVNTAPWASVNTDKQLAEVTARLATDAEWHGGRYAKGGAKSVLTEIRLETLKRYGNDEVLKPRFPDATERAAAMRRNAADWAAKWDANSLIILRRALLGFDTRPDFGKIKAQVLYVLCRTDALFPPKIAPAVMAALTDAGVSARYFEIDSDLGHSSSGPEHAKWSPVLREFLAPLVARAQERRRVRHGGRTPHAAHARPCHDRALPRRGEPSPGDRPVAGRLGLLAQLVAAELPDSS